MENTRNKKPVVKLIKSKVFWARKFSFLLFVSKEGLFFFIFSPPLERHHAEILNEFTDFLTLSSKDLDKLVFTTSE